MHQCSSYFRASFDPPSYDTGLAPGQAGKQAGKQADRQTGRQPDTAAATSPGPGPSPRLPKTGQAGRPGWGTRGWGGLG